VSRDAVRAQCRSRVGDSSAGFQCACTGPKTTEDKSTYSTSNKKKKYQNMLYSRQLKKKTKKKTV